MELGTRVRHIRHDELTGTVIQPFDGTTRWAYELTENGFKHMTAVSVLMDGTGEIRTFSPGVMQAEPYAEND